MSHVPVVRLNNGYPVPILGLGTWKSQPGEVTQAVNDAIDIGYRHIDCAFIYKNENEVGEAIREKIQQGVVKRKDLFITSKLWCTYHRPDLVEEAIRKSLTDLGLDYLDLYLIHWPQGFKEGDALLPKDENGKILYSDVDFVDTWKAMEGLVAKGLTRSIGFSNFNRSQIERVLSIAKVTPAMLQIEIHPYLNQNELIEFCRSQGIAVTAYSPLGSPDRPWAKPGDPKLLEDPKLVSIAKKHNKSVAQVLIRYAIDRSLIVIPKSVNMNRLQQNMDVFDFKLDSDDIPKIGTLECKGRFCTMGDVDHKYYPFHDEY